MQLNEKTTTDQTLPNMDRALPDEEVTVRYLLPANIVFETAVGPVIRTCVGGVVAVPRSVLVPSDEALKTGSSSGGTLIEIRTRRDIANLLDNLVAEIVRLSR